MAKPLPPQFMKKHAPPATKKKAAKRVPTMRVKKSNTPVRPVAPPRGAPMQGGMLDPAPAADPTTPSY